MPRCTIAAHRRLARSLGQPSEDPSVESMTADFIENRTFDEIQIGQTAELQRTLSRDDVALFGKVSGDLNPTHTDEGYALERGAKGVVGHSLWATSLISSLLGNVLPGPGTVYVSQGSNFHQPIDLGDTLTARIRVRERRDGRVVLFDSEVRNQRDELVMDGVAQVVAPAARIRLRRLEAPEVSVRHHDSFGAVFEAVAALEPVPTAVVHPVDQVSLQGAIEAARDGFIRPILVGPLARIRAVADEFGMGKGARLGKRGPGKGARLR